MNNKDFKKLKASVEEMAQIEQGTRPPATVNYITDRMLHKGDVVNVGNQNFKVVSCNIKLKPKFLYKLQAFRA
jgi:hypothetical protein